MLDDGLLVIDMLFLFCSILSVIFTLLVVISRNPIYSSLFLVISFIPIAVIYVLLHAPFVAAIQIMVYAGAIMVLFTFVIMMVHIDKEEIELDGNMVFKIFSALAVVLFVAVVMLKYFTFNDGANMPEINENFGSTQAIGELIFGTPGSNSLDSLQILSFELTSILIMVAIVGTVVLGKKRT